MSAGARAAFSLAEVALALAVLAIAVVSVAALFPVGIRTQQVSRWRLFAAAKAMELVEAFNCADNGNGSIDYEAYNPWDTPASYRNLAPDFESRVACRALGCAPVPLDIARRLDSDGDEIRRALDDGGRLYYAQPAGSTGMRETDLPLTPPPDAQRLVFIVAGHAQENAYNTFPWKAWPYRSSYPSPPLMTQHWPNFLDASGAVVPSGFLEFGMRDVTDMRMYGWEETIDPDIRVVMHWADTGAATPRVADCYGFMQYAYPPPAAGANPSDAPFSLPPTIGYGGQLADPTPYVGTVAGQPNSAIRYVQAALAY
ncbi:MAG TPA: hypothetical protein VEL07_17915, partial [Planctomycetota bacterium]|nr:hypothetical protein [Planctomycetota bacterium]